MSGTWTDISGLIDFQKVFITDISNNAIDVSGARNQISSINANLVALQSNLANSGASLLPTLTFQTDISNILQTETNRLAQKKTNVKKNKNAPVPFRGVLILIAYVHF